MRLLFILIVCLWAGFVKAQEAEAPASQVQNEATQEVDQDGRTTERTYYNSGRLKTSTSYKDGKKDGYERMYYDNGQLKQEFFYTEGRLSYVGREYFADGKLAADAEPLTGLMNRYDEQTGRIIEKVPFINGKMEGTRLFYDAQGKKTGFQECQNSICGPRTDVSDSPWYRYVFSHPNVSFWLVRMPTSIVQTSRMFLQERSQSGLLRIQQMTPEDPQIRIIYAHNEETLPAYVQIEFPMENLQAIVEKEYSYAPRVIVWKLNGIPVWQRVWGDMGTKDEPLNKARVTETKDEENNRKRILVQSPDVTCPLFISFVVDDNDVVKTEDAACYIGINNRRLPCVVR